jgi:hypothetical protein
MQPLSSLYDETYIFSYSMSDFLNNLWINDLSKATPLNFFTGSSLEKIAKLPKLSVDRNAQLTSFFVAKKTTFSNYKPFFSYTTTNNFFTYPIDLIYDLSISPSQDMLFRSMKLKELSNGGKIFIWCDLDTSPVAVARPYYNYLSNEKVLRFFSVNQSQKVIRSEFNLPDSNLLKCNSSDFGLDFDVGEDDFGVLAFINNNSMFKISLVRFSGSIYNFDSSLGVEVLNTSNQASHPQVFIDSKGFINLFFYDNLIVKGSGNLKFTSSDNYYNSFALPTQFDSGYGVGNVLVNPSGTSPNSEDISEYLFHKNDNAFVFFIKQSGSFKRLFYSYYLGSGLWSFPKTVDETINGDVTTFHADINSSGAIVLAFTVSISSYDYVYATSFDSQLKKWNTPKLLIDNVNAFPHSSSDYATNPKVAVDEDGNAVILFSSEDSSGNARLFSVTYY